MGGGLPLRLWYLQGWVRSSSAQSSRPEWPAFSSVRAARTSATERRDRGNPGPSPHPAGGRQIECRNNVGCRILVVSKGAGFDSSLATLSVGQPGSPLLRSLGGRGFKFTLRIEGPRRKPPQKQFFPQSLSPP